jgi:CspA family cold shock protein
MAAKPRAHRAADFNGEQETSMNDEAERQIGTVKFFNPSKGYGFITPDNGDKDVFVHVSAVEQSGIGPLDGGMRVSFDTEPDKHGKGPKAIDLQIVEESS